MWCVESLYTPQGVMFLTNPWNETCFQKIKYMFVVISSLCTCAL